MTKEPLEPNADDMSKEALSAMWRNVPPAPEYKPSKADNRDKGNADTDTLYGGRGGI